jgi:hypothetical protein
MDTGIFLDIEYASFTELGWFNYQLREGESSLLGASITIIKE